METKKSAAETSTPSPVPLHPLKEEESNTTITTTNTEPTTKKKKIGGAHKKKKKKRTKTSSNNHSNNNKSNGTNKKNQSSSSSLNNNNNNNRTKKSCHHCRASHLKCDGKRPCSRCVSKKRECIEYDPNLIYSANHETAKNSNHSSNTINHTQYSMAEQQLQKNDDHSDCDDCDTDGDVHMEQHEMKATRRSHHHTRLSDQSSSGPRRKPSISTIRKNTTHDNNSSSGSSKSGSDLLTSRSKRRKMNHRDHSEEEEEEEEDNPTLTSNNYHSRVLSPDSISHILQPSDSSSPSLDCPLHLSTGTAASNFVSNDENAMFVDDEKNNMFRDMMVDDENTMGSTYSCSSSCSSPEAIVGEVVCFSGLNYSNPDVYRIVGLFEQDSIPDPVMYDSELDFMGQYGKNTINNPYTTRRGSSSSLSDSNIDFDHEEMAKRLAFNFSNSFATTSTM